MNYDVITLENCMAAYEFGWEVVLKHGHAVDFKKKGERSETDCTYSE